MMAKPSSTAFALTQVQFFQNDQLLTGLAVVIDQGKIVAIQAETELPVDISRVDCHQALLAPGFIDTQVNGGGGVMLNDHPTVEGIKRIVAAHWQGGTTNLLPTLITDSDQVMHAAVNAVATCLETKMVGVAGIHLEGPYLSLQRPGVHSKHYIRAFTQESFSFLQRLPSQQYLLTIAPETFDLRVIRELADQGIRLSAGHTAANYQQMRQAIDAGVGAVTHLYNAMTSMTGREPGVVGAALEDDNVYCGIIIDGYHLHPTTAKLAIQQKARGKMLLVTDAMATVGSADNSFTLYGETIYEVDGRCARADGTLAGSALDMATAVRNCVNSLGLALPEALRMASLYPATFLGLAHKVGKIQVGYQADLVLLSPSLQVEQTWVQGELKYSRA